MRFVTYGTSATEVKGATQTWVVSDTGRLYDEQVVDIETIDELLAFIDSNEGQVVIQRWRHGSNMWAIEVYNDYRE